MKRNYLFLLIFVAVLCLVPGILVSDVAEAQILGTNWTGQFYNTNNLSGGVVATAAYPNGLNFNWGNGGPRDSTGNVIPGVNSDNFSALFSSSQNITQPGSYRFTVRVNDGVRVRINGQLLLDRFTQVAAGSFAEYVFNTNLNAGANSMEVEYVDFTNEAILQVQWAFLGTSVPTSTAEPPATASVVRVRGLSVRTGPFLGASLITVARPNIAYPVLAYNNEEGLFTWYKLQVGDSIGWSSGRYLEVRGDLTQIPEETTTISQLGQNNLGNYPAALNVTGVTRSVMNLRRYPSERTQLLDQVPWGDTVEVFGRTIQGFDNHWLFIRWNGKVGWIYAPYVGLNGIVDAVPIY